MVIMESCFTPNICKCPPLYMSRKNLYLQGINGVTLNVTSSLCDFTITYLYTVNDHQNSVLPQKNLLSNTNAKIFPTNCEIICKGRNDCYWGVFFLAIKKDYIPDSIHNIK